MTDHEFDLRTTLEALESFLRAHKVRYAARVRQILDDAGADEDRLRRDAATMFRGTVGSLPDVFISRQNGNVVSDERAANARLDEFTERLRRELL